MNNVETSQAAITTICPNLMTCLRERARAVDVQPGGPARGPQPGASE